jgi:hypothetical protein
MPSKRWSWLAGFAVLFAGITNAHSHVHYCFDGQEPPAAVHLVDSADHHHETIEHHDDGTRHDDLDVDVQNQALAKVVKYDLPAIPVVAWAMTLDAIPDDTLEARLDTPRHPSPRYALPQLRAPPR